MCGFSRFFFFEQKMAFVLRIIDWSSDVCSSDQPAPRDRSRGSLGRLGRMGDRGGRCRQGLCEGNAQEGLSRRPRDGRLNLPRSCSGSQGKGGRREEARSEERRVGKCGSKCRSRWAPYHNKKKKHKVERDN